MFNIIINGEVIETVMYENYRDAFNYASEEYYDEKFYLKKVG